MSTVRLAGREREVPSYGKVRACRKIELLQPLKPFICKPCDRVYLTGGALRNHEQNHPEANVRRPHCFKTAENLVDSIDFVVSALR